MASAAPASKRPAGVDPDQRVFLDDLRLVDRCLEHDTQTEAVRVFRAALRAST
jgi:hypothetical protein